MTIPHIAIDIRPLHSAYADHGVGTYVRNIVSRLVRSPMAPSLLLLGTAPHTPFVGARYQRIWRPRLRPWIWEQVMWPLDLWRTGAGILHSLASLGPVRNIGLPYVCAGRTIATVYDFSSKRVAGLQSDSGTRSFRIQFAALSRARLVVVTSEAVRGDVIGMAGVRHNKVAVLPGAVDDQIRMIYETGTFPAAKSERPYILTIGETANKNIAMSISVFEHLAGSGYNGDLYVVGKKEEQTAEVTETVLKSRFGDRIVFLGRISSSELVGRYAGAQMLLFPSLSEGFGFPVLEAMYCGTPVLCSNTTSLPEVGGNAALYSSPADTAGFVSQAQRILDSNEFRASLVEKGRKQAASFSWDSSVEKLIHLYEQTGRNH